jgi:hypothetical protein
MGKNDANHIFRIVPALLDSIGSDKIDQHGSVNPRASGETGPLTVMMNPRVFLDVCPLNFALIANAGQNTAPPLIAAAR